MSILRPCARCLRHVRSGDPCPFCGCAAPARTTLAALAIAGSLVTSSLVAGCGGGAAASDTTTTPSNDPGPTTTEERTERAPVENDPDARGPDGVGAVAAYGAPAPPEPSGPPPE